MLAAGRHVGVVDSRRRIFQASTVLPAQEQHWLKHVLIEQQWAPDVGQQEYLDDLAEAVQHSLAWVFTYTY